MGKSEGNAIYLADDPDTIRKKVMRAVTDGGPTQTNQEKPQSIQNLFDIMKIVSTPDTFSYFDEQYNTCKIKYSEIKKQLAEDINNFVAPLRSRISEIAKDETIIKKVADIGRDKARESASKTIYEVRKIIGFRTF